MQPKLIALALGFGLFVSAAPAAAQASDGNTVAPKEQIYCLEFKEDTGSHVNRRECRTKQEWKRLGVDVDDLQSS